ncbi:MAG: hypothetical protein AB7Q45_23785 [Planctomycetaceae bacterium]
MFTRILRPCVIGLGLALMLTGSALLFVDEVTLRDAAEMDRARMPSVFVRLAPSVPHQFRPPPWLPVTLMATGGLTVLYSLALPRPIPAP